MSERASSLDLRLLNRVSRAFYLTIRVLPKRMREPVGLAYLLARGADTIADTAALPVDRRRERLRAFRDAVERGEAAGLDGEATGAGEDERRLLRELPRLVAALGRMPDEDRARVRAVVAVLISGMEYDLGSFPAEDSGRIGSLESFDELDRYTYLVAGCVGEFWTATSIAHVQAIADWEIARMSVLGVRFGKALQLVNVLRDVPGDLRIGRCYLPRGELARRGVEPEALLHPASAERARPVLLEGLARALAHFRAAEDYLFTIPRRCVRLRLAVLWPLLMGLATLGVLVRNEDWLDPDHPSKVSRGWVYRMLFLSSKLVLSNTLLRAWIDRLHRNVERELPTRPSADDSELQKSTSEN